MKVDFWKTADLVIVTAPMGLGLGRIGNRFFVEFFREPDSQGGYIMGVLTMGQILSIGMILSGTVIYYLRRRVHTAGNT